MINWINEIKELLTKTYFTKVIYDSATYFLVKEEKLLDYRAEFYDPENDCWDVPTEYMESETKTIMKQIVEIFKQNNASEKMLIILKKSKMDNKTLDALKGSIAKWQAIVDGTGEDLGCDNCPLCQLFWDNECVNCPVYEKTGEWRCDGSPYINYDEDLDDEAKKRSAQAELDFLISLLPEEN